MTLQSGAGSRATSETVAPRRHRDSRKDTHRGPCPHPDGHGIRAGRRAWNPEPGARACPRHDAVTVRITKGLISTAERLAPKRRADTSDRKSGADRRWPFSRRGTRRAGPESDPLRDRRAPTRRKGVNHEGADAARRNAFSRVSSCRHHERPSQRPSEFSRLHRLAEHETLSQIEPDLARGD